MEAKQKADELIEKFKNFASGEHNSVMEKDNAKQCALIACEEIIYEIKKGLNSDWGHVRNKTEDTITFWQSVKDHLINR